MARKKVKLAWIQNDSARRATFKKRRKGLMKKVSELSTLCNVKACAIVYSPHESMPEVWPPNNQEVMRVLNQFRSMPEMEQTKKMLNQERFLRDRIKKLSDRLKKTERDNREVELTSLMYRCIAGRTLQDLSINVVTNLGWLLELKLKVVHDKIESLCAATLTSNMMVSVPFGDHQNYLGTYAAPPTLEGSSSSSTLEMGNLDSAMEMWRRSTEMFVYSPQLLWPSTVDEGALSQYVDNHIGPLPTSYPDQNNHSWLDNYFQG